MKAIRWLALCATLAAAFPAGAQTSVFPAATVTGSGQTTTAIRLGQSFSVGTITVTGTSLTTATFAVLGSSDGGTTYSALAVSAVGSPSTTGTSTTVTANGLYQVNLASITNVEFQTSGTFTATSVSLLLTASTAGTVGRNGGGSGGTGITQITGDVAAGPGPGSVPATLATVNSSPGTCGDATHVCQVTTVGKGLVTAQSQVAIAASGINQLTGDVAAGPGTGSVATTLATVNSSPGTCGDATHVCQVTTVGKGLVTAQAQVAIAPATSNPSICTANNFTDICITQSPYNGSAAGATTTTGTFSGGATSGTVGSCATFAAGNGLLIAGGASGGWNNTSYIGAVVSCSGTALVITPAITNAVSGTVVQHDESAAFNAATAAAASIGGTVRFPTLSSTDRGLYLMAGPLLQTGGANSILPMPLIANYSATPTVVRVLGMTGHAYDAPIIRTPLNTAGAKLFGGFDSAAGGGFPNFTNVILLLDSIHIQGPDGGDETLVDGTWLLGLEATNVTVDTPTPVRGHGNGILFPTISNNIYLKSDNLAVSGFSTCVRGGEHQQGAKLILSVCTKGLVPDAAPTGGGFANNTNSMHFDSVWCGPTTNAVTNCIASGANKAAITIDNLDWEDNTGNTMVSDAGNLLTGYIGYNRPFQSCGTARAVTGAANLQWRDLKCTTGGTATVTTAAAVAGHLAIFAADGIDISDGGAFTFSWAFPTAGTATSKATFPGGDLFGPTINGQTGTTYTVAASDENGVTTFNNASAVAVTLPAATTTGFGAGGYFTFINLGAGTVTITPTTSTVNLAAFITLATGQSARITSDGANYAAELGAGAGGLTGTLPIVVTGNNVACPTCSVGSGTSTQVNSGGALGTLNLNSATPAAPAGASNCTWQISGSNASCYVVQSAPIFTRTLFNTTKAVNTIYQNTSGLPIIVDVAVTASNQAATLLSDTSPTPTTQRQGCRANPGGCSMKAFVPNNSYYEVTGTSLTVTNWTEWAVGTTTVTDSGELSGSRVVGTIYQNTTGSCMVLSVQSTAQTGTMTANVDASATPTSVVFNQTPLNSSVISTFIPVPNNFYYKATGLTLSSWREYRLSVPCTQTDTVTGTAPRTALTSFQNVTTKNTLETITSGSTTSKFTQAVLAWPSVPPAFNIGEWEGTGSGNTTASVISAPLDFLYTYYDSVTYTITHWWEYTFN